MCIVIIWLDWMISDIDCVLHINFIQMMEKYNIINPAAHVSNVFFLFHFIFVKFYCATFCWWSAMFCHTIRPVRKWDFMMPHASDAIKMKTENKHSDKTEGKWTKKNEQRHCIMWLVTCTLHGEYVCVSRTHMDNACNGFIIHIYGSYYVFSVWMFQMKM